MRRVTANPTRVVLDLGYRNMPVDELYVTATTRRYDRDASVAVQGQAWRIEVSSDGRAEGERYDGVVPGPGAVVLTDGPS